MKPCVSTSTAAISKGVSVVTAVMPTVLVAKVVLDGVMLLAAEESANSEASVVAVRIVWFVVLTPMLAGLFEYRGVRLYKSA